MSYIHSDHMASETSTVTLVRVLLNLSGILDLKIMPNVREWSPSMEQSSLIEMQHRYSEDDRNLVTEARHECKRK